MQTLIYNGMTYHYTHDTKFILQTGRYRNKYQTREVRIGDFKEIINEYENLELSNGYKKRIIMLCNNSSKHIIITRYLSKRDN